jgi:hypothetical protein
LATMGLPATPILFKVLKVYLTLLKKKKPEKKKKLIHTKQRGSKEIRAAKRTAIQRTRNSRFVSPQFLPSRHVCLNFHNCHGREKINIYRTRVRDAPGEEGKNICRAATLRFYHCFVSPRETA